MRKVTEQVAYAFWRGDSRKVSNSETDGQRFWLHGNLIARRLSGDALEFTMHWWPTPTTRERLNGIFETFGIPVRLFQMAHEQYLSFYASDCTDPHPIDAGKRYRITRENYYQGGDWAGAGWSLVEVRE